MVYKILKYDIVDIEIFNAIIYYESISMILSLKFETNINLALDSLEINPENYFNLPDKIHRRIVINKFPFAFIYIISEEVVLIKMLFPMVLNPEKLWIGLK